MPSSREIFFLRFSEHRLSEWGTGRSFTDSLQIAWEEELSIPMETAREFYIPLLVSSRNLHFIRETDRWRHFCWCSYGIQASCPSLINQYTACTWSDMHLRNLKLQIVANPWIKLYFCTYPRVHFIAFAPLWKTCLNADAGGFSLICQRWIIEQVEQRAELDSLLHQLPEQALHALI